MSFAYHAHGTADMHVVMNPAVTNSAWFVCHDKPLNQQCIAHSGSPHDDTWIILLVVQVRVECGCMDTTHWQEGRCIFMSQRWVKMLPTSAMSSHILFSLRSHDNTPSSFMSASLVLLTLWMEMEGLVTRWWEEWKLGRRRGWLGVRQEGGEEREKAEEKRSIYYHTSESGMWSCFREWRKSLSSTSVHGWFEWGVGR